MTVIVDVKLIKDLRADKGYSQRDLAAEAGVGVSTIERIEKGLAVSLDAAQAVAAAFNISHTAIVVRYINEEPFGQQTLFDVLPEAGIGPNLRPHPEQIDEDKGYCFSGIFNLMTKKNCNVSRLIMNVKRNEHYAICCGPGRDKYENLPMIEGKNYFGRVKINGEHKFVDGNYDLIEPINFVAGQNFKLSISHWCRAILRSRKVEATESLWYWLDDPCQSLEIKYRVDRSIYFEHHDFKFKRGVMVHAGSRRVIAS